MYRTYFNFSSGLNQALTVRAGYYAELLEHVEKVETALHIEREQYLDNPAHWKRTEYENVSDDVLCDWEVWHNFWVRGVYEYFGEVSQNEPAGDTEIITPEMAQEFWPALRMIYVPLGRWTAGHYVRKIDELFAVMTTGEHRGVSFDAPVLTPKQTHRVVRLFSNWMDKHGVRMELPRGRDYLVPSDECQWCVVHGDAVLYEDGCEFCDGCEAGIKEECYFAMEVYDEQ